MAERHTGEVQVIFGDEDGGVVEPCDWKKIPLKQARALLAGEAVIIHHHELEGLIIAAKKGWKAPTKEAQKWFSYIEQKLKAMIGESNG